MIITALLIMVKKKLEEVFLVCCYNNALSELYLPVSILLRNVTLLLLPSRGRVNSPTRWTLGCTCHLLWPVQCVASDTV